MMTSIPEGSQEDLSNELDQIEGIKFYLTETKKLPSHDVPTHRINLSGGDNEGIVHYMSDKLTLRGINILEIITDTKNAPITGAVIFLMEVKISLEDSQVQDLLDELNDIQSRLGVDIVLDKI